MTFAELEAIVSGGESEQVEFKETTGARREACQTICGMLNGRGGFVLFGVRDSGQIAGFQVSAKTQEDVVRELARIDPRALLQLEVVPLGNGNSVIAIRVPGGMGGPFTYDGRPYVRQGPTTSVMPQEIYRQRLLEQMHPTHRWEIQPASGLAVADLDAGEITRTVDEAVRRGRLDEPGTRDREALLSGLGLIDRGQLLNAAVVLFGAEDRLQLNYPQCTLRLARFRGLDKTEAIDARQETGHAFRLLERAQRFLRENLPVAGRVVPNLFERVDDPLYPPEALREALANAICHRDYVSPGGSVSIAIYDDRLEISSTGRLPFGLTPADLAQPHTSHPWNPLIAKVLFRRGLIEQWGRGTIKIRELTERAGLAKPEFEDRGGEVVVRFFPTAYIPPSRISHPVSPLQQQLLNVLAQRGTVRLGELVEALPDTPQRTIQDNLKALREWELVDGVGKGRGATWKLKGT